jgi:molybdopterin-guanine dinucleotide biosynthesis adapter protein
MKVFGFAGYSGSGKTTLIEKVIPELIASGLRVSLIKHAHHSFDIDKPGKDSYRHREAGAHEVLIASSQRWVLMHELRAIEEPSLDELLLKFSDCDLVLVEGYKFSAVPKIEIHRPEHGKPRLDAKTHNIVALASSITTENEALLQIDLNDARAVAEFVLKYCGFGNFNGGAK